MLLMDHIMDHQYSIQKHESHHEIVLMGNQIHHEYDHNHLRYIVIGVYELLYDYQRTVLPLMRQIGLMMMLCVFSNEQQQHSLPHRVLYSTKLP